MIRSMNRSFSTNRTEVSKKRKTMFYFFLIGLGVGTYFGQTSAYQEVKEKITTTFFSVKNFDEVTTIISEILKPDVYPVTPVVTQAQTTTETSSKTPQ